MGTGEIYLVLSRDQQDRNSATRPGGKGAKRRGSVLCLSEERGRVENATIVSEITCDAKVV